VIFGELVCGHLEDKSQRYFEEVIDGLAQRGVRSRRARLYGDPTFDWGTQLAIADP
jgi:hypothetical protein